MIRFEDFERTCGCTASFSDKSDGDCRLGFDDVGGGAKGFLARCGVDSGALFQVRQVHGTSIAVACVADSGRTDARTKPVEADGIVTDVPGLPIVVLVADCVPVYLVDPVARVAGLLHAGRQGTFDNIAGEGVRAMCGGLGARPERIHAVVGPSAGPERYEVSLEMADEWVRAGLPASGRLLDLWGANALQLEVAGVPRGQITVCGLCTMSDGRFYSHRNGADGCRNMALLTLNGA